MIKDSGERTQFYDQNGKEIGVRDLHTGKGRMDLLPWNAIMAVSKHAENGAIKYGPHNVDKGIPVSSLFDSGVRHAAKWWCNHEDEPHLVAACWNFLWALEMCLTKPEMDDRPKEDGCPNCGAKMRSANCPGTTTADEEREVLNVRDWLKNGSKMEES